MTKAIFNKTKNLELLLLKKLNILKEQNHVYEISNYPNFDMTEYDKHKMKNYFFQDKKSFENVYLTVLEANVTHSKILNPNDIANIKNEYFEIIKSEEELDDTETLLSIISNSNDDFLDHHGHKMLNNRDCEWLRFNHLDLKVLHGTKEFLFSGTYEAESCGIDPMDVYFFIQCKVLGISCDIEKGEFYKELLAEAYRFYLEGTYKIAYFLLFSAFESYINYKLQSHDEQKRLSEKISELFKQTFGDISKHQIYTSYICEFKSFEKNRNTIAHGKESVSIDKEDILKVLTFVLVFINSIEQSISTFDDMISKEYLHVC